MEGGPAVIDVTEGSPSYGELVNTATIGPLVENEPHHMQYTWHKGDAVYAGGLFSSVTYSFDMSAPTASAPGTSARSFPAVRLRKPPSRPSPQA